MAEETSRKQKSLKCNKFCTGKLILKERSAMPGYKYENVERNNDFKKDYTSQIYLYY